MKFGKDYKEVASQVLGCNLSSFYNWDNQGRPIVKLLQTYFPNKKDLEEFLETGKISRLELYAEEEEERFYSHTQYLHIFLDKNQSSRFAKNSDYGYDFYFSTLLKITNMIGDEHIPFLDVYEYAWLSLYQTVEDQNSFTKDETIPIFSNFGCGSNKALKINLYHNFEPMIKIAKEDLFTDEEKKEAYMHGLLFNLYSSHSEKSLSEKKYLLKTTISSLSPNKVNEVNNDVLFTSFISLNIDLIESNYDLIVKSLVDNNQ